MYIDSFTTWLDTRAKYVLRADRVRSEITGLLQIIGMNNYDYNTSQFWMRLGDTSVELKDPSINLLDLLRRYHEYIDTHTLANFLVAQGGHKFIWKRKVAKVDTWKGADGVWLQVVFADNGECLRISSMDVYQPPVRRHESLPNFIGFYLSSLESVAGSTVHPHDFTRLILGDPFLSAVLNRINPGMCRNVPTVFREDLFWFWTDPATRAQYHYRLRQTPQKPQNPVQLLSSNYRNN